MNRYITKDTIESSSAVCIKELQRTVEDTASSEVRLRALRFDGGPVLSILAWQIVGPFIVGVLSGLSIEGLKAWRAQAAGLSTEEIKKKVYSKVGESIEFQNDNKREECVLLVEELLSPFGVDRSQARKIIETLRNNVEMSKTGKD